MSGVSQSTKPSEEASARKVSRRWPLISAIVTVVLAAALGATIAVRGGNLPLETDTEWLEEIAESRSIVFDVPALFMDWLGGGLVGALIVPLATVAVLCLFRRFWAALYYAIAAALSAGIVQLLKAVFDRPRPEDMMVLSDAGSFPSGHVANAATIAVTLGIIFSKPWVWIAGVRYTILMLLSRTYLCVHWFSDTIGGLLIGAGVAISVWAPFALRLQRERETARNHVPRTGATR